MYQKRKMRAEKMKSEDEKGFKNLDIMVSGES